MRRARSRTSRIIRRCDCGRTICPGDRYIEHVASPNDPDIGNTGWRRVAECSECAIRYGREQELGTVNLKGTWLDPAIVDDSRISHDDPLTIRIAERLHRNESMHMHWYIGSLICPYCALRASHAVAELSLGLATTEAPT